MKIIKMLERIYLVLGLPCKIELSPSDHHRPSPPYRTYSRGQSLQCSPGSKPIFGDGRSRDRQ